MPEYNDRSTDGLSRRTFVQATGAAAGAGLLGGSAGEVLASEDLEAANFLEFANPRVLRASHAWRRGYRGRPDRTLALTDTGTDSRHPDVGPWNGVTATTKFGELELWEHAHHDDPETASVGEESFSGVAFPTQEGVYEGEVHALDVPDDAEALEMVMQQDVPPAILSGVLFELHEPEEGDEPERIEVSSVRHPGATVTYEWLDPDHDYELVVFVGDAPSTYAIDVEYLEYTANAPERRPVDDPFADVDDLPQLVGWHNDNTRYGAFRAPRDEDSHGTHVAGIMAGSGRASGIREALSEIHEPNAVLVAGDVLTYEVDAEADTGVFAAAYGQGIEIVIDGPDGERLRRSLGTQGTSEESMRNNTAEAPTVHDAGEATYTVHVRPTEGEPLPARVQRVAVGAFCHHTTTDGSVHPPDEGGHLGFHAGVAPGYSILSMSALSGPTLDLGEHAEAFAETFGLRAVNMSWGYLAGAPIFGTVAGAGDDIDLLGALRDIANAGILPVGAAGNDATPASGNTPPNAANETISAVATGPLDGIAAYSSGGIGAVDDETQQPYGTPDVTAIGGVVPDLDQSAMPGDFEADDPRTDDEAFGSERTYSGKGGTSMAAPSVTGAAGLVAQAMEEDAPDPIALPEPGDAGIEDTMRLKQAILATASTTAFHAAPYHRGKAPTYTHAERDPYEGFGRMNVGAAVDAVTRDLRADGELDGYEVLGLDVPADEQAAAGYVHAGAGTVEVAVEFSHYSGGNEGMTRAPPHVDLFVYDAEEPAGLAEDEPTTGDPNVVASAPGPGGSASVSFEAEEEGVYFVVAKLVAVPGVVNGYDVQAHLDLDVELEDPPLPLFGAEGDRELDTQVVSGRQANRVELTVSDLDDDAEIRDRFPEEWRFLGQFSDGEAADDGVVEFGTVAASDVADNDEETFVYFVESPDTVEESGPYAFGPAAAERVGDGEFQNDSAEFAGEDDALVVGVDV